MQKLFTLSVLIFLLCSELILAKSSAKLENVREVRQVNPSDSGVLIKNEKIDKIGKFIRFHLYLEFRKILKLNILLNRRASRWWR